MYASDCGRRKEKKKKRMSQSNFATNLDRIESNVKLVINKSTAKFNTDWIWI